MAAIASSPGASTRPQTRLARWVGGLLSLWRGARIVHQGRRSAQHPPPSGGHCASGPAASAPTRGAWSGGGSSSAALWRSTPRSPPVQILRLALGNQQAAEVGWHHRADTTRRNQRTDIARKRHRVFRLHPHDARPLLRKQKTETVHTCRQHSLRRKLPNEETERRAGNQRVRRRGGSSAQQRRRLQRPVNRGKPVLASTRFQSWSRQVVSLVCCTS